MAGTMRLLYLTGGVALVVLRLAAPAAQQPLARPAIDDTAPGWRALAESDFVHVNDEPTTWAWRDGMLVSTGMPIGVLRTSKTFTNFELVVEWRHLKAAGNSGAFLWVPPDALADLKPGTLPKFGIEIQMLDHGYTDQYEKSSGKKADWFTTNGDVFGVGATKFTPFPPVSPNGQRSFPRKNLSHGVGRGAAHRLLVHASRRVARRIPADSGPGGVVES